MSPDLSNLSYSTQILDLIKIIKVQLNTFKNPANSLFFGLTDLFRERYVSENIDPVSTKSIKPLLVTKLSFYNTVISAHNLPS